MLPAACCGCALAVVDGHLSRYRRTYCALSNPAPNLPLGKETTYVVGPLDKHGYIDYEAALNAELSKGISPEKNANVLLIQVLGPAPD